MDSVLEFFAGAGSVFALWLGAVLLRDLIHDVARWLYASIAAMEAVVLVFAVIGILSTGAFIAGALFGCAGVMSYIRQQRRVQLREPDIIVHDRSRPAPAPGGESRSIESSPSSSGRADGDS